MNFLEELAAEWYEFQGYFVRRNILVGPRAKGGYECELDVVAYHPSDQHLVRIEPSMDAHSWARRDERYGKKFEAGQKYIPQLFSGIDLPEEIEQIALLGYASKANRQTVGGGKILLVEELLATILASLRDTSMATSAVPEDKPILRTLQMVSDNHRVVSKALEGLSEKTEA